MKIRNSCSLFSPAYTECGIKRELGTRHRAALGITEVSDAIAVVVSEESGKFLMLIVGPYQKPYTGFEKSIEQIVA